MSILRLAAIAVTLSALCFALPINVAASANGGVATQSSTDFGGPASRANDGNTDGTYNNGSVSHTAFEKGAWWQVNFNSPYLIDSITIFNRTDCCQERVNTFSVSLYDALNVQVWTSGPGQSFVVPTPNTPVTFSGINFAASSLKVQLDGTNWLHLAEVQALGDVTSAGPEPSTYALMAGGLAALGLLRRRKQ